MGDPREPSHDGHPAHRARTDECATERDPAPAQRATRAVFLGFSGGSRSGHGSYVFGQIEFAPSPTSPVTFGFRVATVRATTTGKGEVGQFRRLAETGDAWPTFMA